MAKMRKWVSALLVICMLFSMIPTAVADPPQQDESEHEELVRYMVLLLDCSGSMSGTPMDAQKKAAIKFCEDAMKAKGNNHIAIVPFSSSTSRTTDFYDEIDALKQRINELYANGGTNINAALTYAEELLADKPETAVRNIVLLTDGCPESGVSSSEGPYKSEDSWCYDYANVY